MEQSKQSCFSRRDSWVQNIPFDVFADKPTNNTHWQAPADAIAASEHFYEIQCTLVHLLCLLYYK
jgi:hypothetical protein